MTADRTPEELQEEMEAARVKFEAWRRAHRPTLYLPNKGDHDPMQDECTLAKRGE